MPNTLRYEIRYKQLGLIPADRMMLKLKGKCRLWDLGKKKPYLE